jgi:hypothetical protein
MVPVTTNQVRSFTFLYNTICALASDWSCSIAGLGESHVIHAFPHKSPSQRVAKDVSNHLATTQLHLQYPNFYYSCERNCTAIEVQASH